MGKDFSREYNELLLDLEKSAVLTENEALKKEISQLKLAYEETDKKLTRLLEENKGLQLALREQILSEKLNILKVSKEKIDLYFKKAHAAKHNSLVLLELESRRKLASLQNVVERELVDESNYYSAKINKLSEEIKDKVNQKKEALNRYMEARHEIDHKAVSIAGEEISGEVIKKRVKQNSFELKVGLKWLNWIGMFLILLGVGSLLHWSYYNLFTEWMKGLFAFLVGILFSVTGERFNLKGKNAFGLGLTGGGIAILYYAIFNSYFTLGIISLELAALISMVITAIAFSLSFRYKSKTICVFALVGGYLPFFAYWYHYSLSGMNIPLVIGYFALLHLLTLLIAFRQRWIMVSYISFLLNLPTLIIIAYTTANHFVNIIYTFYVFLLYLGIVLAYPIKSKMTLGNVDIALLAANTVASFSILFYLFQQGGIADYRGLLTILFSLVFFSLARFMKRYSPGEEKASLLFHLTALTFIILFIPVQFRLRWLALGWLVEAVLLIVYGKNRNYSGFEKSGWIIYLLCIGAFLMVDLPHYLTGTQETLFAFKYTVITAGSIMVLMNYLFSFREKPSMEYSKTGEIIRYFKYILVINFWLYLAYIANHLYVLYLVPLFDQDLFFFDQVVIYHQYVIIGLATLLSGLILSFIKIIHDRITVYLNTFIYTMAVLITFVINFTMPSPLFHPAETGSYRIIAAIIIVVYNLLVILGLRDMLLRLMKEVRFNSEYYPLILALYLMGNVTAVLVIQFNLGELNLLLSFFYLLLAFACILGGFRYGYIYLRRLGLGLSLMATGKLFLFDLAYLSDVSRVLALFAFGLTMLAISYTYHRLNTYMSDDHKEPK